MMTGRQRLKAILTGTASRVNPANWPMVALLFLSSSIEAIIPGVD